SPEVIVVLSGYYAELRRARVWKALLQADVAASGATRFAARDGIRAVSLDQSSQRCSPPARQSPSRKFRRAVGNRIRRRSHPRTHGLLDHAKRFRGALRALCGALPGVEQACAISAIDPRYLPHRDNGRALAIESYR